MGLGFFMLEFQLGSVICELCGCLCACSCICVFVCLYEFLDGILMFSHMMVGIGDRPS